MVTEVHVKSYLDPSMKVKLSFNDIYNKDTLKPGQFVLCNDRIYTNPHTVHKIYGAVDGFRITVESLTDIGKSPVTIELPIIQDRYYEINLLNSTEPQVCEIVTYLKRI